jgi:hypothetical protein
MPADPSEISNDLKSVKEENNSGAAALRGTFNKAMIKENDETRAIVKSRRRVSEA